MTDDGMLKWYEVDGVPRANIRLAEKFGWIELNPADHGHTDAVIKLILFKVNTRDQPSIRDFAQSQIDNLGAEPFPATE